jgi:hypothetical protein
MLDDRYDRFIDDIRVVEVTVFLYVTFESLTLGKCKMTVPYTKINPLLSVHLFHVAAFI